MPPPGNSNRLPAVFCDCDWRGGGQQSGREGTPMCTHGLAQRKGGDFCTSFSSCLGIFKSFFCLGKLRALPGFNSPKLGRVHQVSPSCQNSHLNAKAIDFLMFSFGFISLPVPHTLCLPSLPLSVSVHVFVAWPRCLDVPHLCVFLGSCGACLVPFITTLTNSSRA